MTPTCSELTSTLSGAPSPDSTLENAICAARLTEVGALLAPGALAPMFRTLMIRPQRRCFIWEDQPGEADLREQLEIEIGLPHLVGHFLGWAAGRLPGVVDQYVDLAELRHHLVIGPADVGQLGDVGADRGDLTLGPGLDLLLARGQSLGGAREDRDVRTGRGKPLRHRQAQPFAAAGDHGSASVQSNVHVRLPSPRLRAPSSDQPIDFLHLLGCQCPGRFRAGSSAGRSPPASASMRSERPAAFLTNSSGPEKSKAL